MQNFLKTEVTNYQHELTDYKKILGSLPTDKEEELERVILNPESEKEVDFFVACLKFCNDTTKIFEQMTLKMRENNECEYVIANWLSTLEDIFLHQSYSYEIKKKYYDELLQLHPELIEQISNWTKTKLKRILLEPTTEEEYRLCRNYLDYLGEEVNFSERKENYLERLSYRHEIIKKQLKSPYKKDMVEVLLEPLSEKELDFGIAFLGFYDDKKRIIEAVQEGIIKPINPEESVAVNYLTEIIDVLINDKEMEDKLLFLKDPSKTAEVLYELSILECQKDDLINTIITKLGYSTREGISPRDYFNIYINYDTATQLIDDLVFYGINREDKNNKIDKFLNIAERFHTRYITDTYEDASSLKLSPQEKSKVNQKVSSKKK